MPPAILSQPCVSFTHGCGVGAGVGAVVGAGVGEAVADSNWLSWHIAVAEQMRSLDKVGAVVSYCAVATSHTVYSPYSKSEVAVPATLR
jgi:hypothetical protein